jgi:hypothetical protein
MMRAVARSQGAEREMKSPKEDMRSAPNEGFSSVISNDHCMYMTHAPRARA